MSMTYDDRRIQEKKVNSFQDLLTPLHAKVLRKSNQCLDIKGVEVGHLKLGQMSELFIYISHDYLIVEFKMKQIIINAYTSAR
jgi:hypothetical protein